MIEKKEKVIDQNKFWQISAYITGGFALIVSILLIVNFLQINRIDPVNTETINLLVERLNQNPGDLELRQEIRQLDLLARKAYFTTRWQIRTGGYILLISLALMIISLQVLEQRKKRSPDLQPAEKSNLLLTQKHTRVWISIAGGAIVILAVVSAFLTYRGLENRFITASLPPKEIIIEEPDKIQENKVEAIATEEKSNDETITENEEAAIPDTISEEKPVDDQKIPEAIPEKIKTIDVPVAINNKEILQNFPSFRGVGSNGIDFHKDLPTNWNGETGENILWKIAIPLPGYNSPVIWGNKLFLTGADETTRAVYCIDRESGQILWTTELKDIQGSPEQSPEVANYTGHAAPTAAVDKNHVYAIFANGDIAAFDHNGTKKWGRNLGVPQNHYGYSSSLLVYNNKVFVQYDNKNMKEALALNSNTGETVWKTTRDVKISWASPVIANTGSRTELILAADPYVASYDPETGKELWRINCIYGEVGPSVAYANGYVFSVNEYAILSAIKLGNTPEIAWEDEELLSDVPSPVATNQLLFLPTSYGVVACYDNQTGKKYWEHELDNTVYASPMINEGRVFLVDKQGIMHIFKAEKEFEYISKPPLGEKTVCTPAFMDGRIYLRGYDNLYCIGN